MLFWWVWVGLVCLLVWCLVSPSQGIDSIEVWGNDRRTTQMWYTGRRWSRQETGCANRFESAVWGLVALRDVLLGDRRHPRMLRLITYGNPNRCGSPDSSLDPTRGNRDINLFTSVFFGDLSPGRHGDGRKGCQNWKTKVASLGDAYLILLLLLYSCDRLLLQSIKNNELWICSEVSNLLEEKVDLVQFNLMFNLLNSSLSTQRYVWILWSCFVWLVAVLIVLSVLARACEDCSTDGGTSPFDCVCGTPVLCEARGIVSFPSCWSLVCLSGSQAIHA